MMHPILAHSLRRFLCAGAAAFVAIAGPMLPAPAQAQVPDTLKLTIPSPNAPTHIGFPVVAMSGTRIVVGDREHYSACVYDLASSNPAAPIFTLQSPSADGEDFGWAVAIDGNRIAIGAPLDDTLGYNSGRVYIYDLSSGTPTVPVQVLENPAPSPSPRQEHQNEYFGYSVGVSGSHVIVGTPLDDYLRPTTGDPYPDFVIAQEGGRAYVYDVANATPTVPIATLDNPDPHSLDHFGYRVAIDGNRAAVTLLPNDNGGKVFVYDLTAPATPAYTLSKPEGSLGGEFGWALAISGSRIAVGAVSESTDGLFSGRSYIFDVAGTDPTAPAQILTNPGPSANGNFGWSIGISGSLVAVGAPGDDTAATDAGGIYVYDLSSPTPSNPKAILTKPDAAASERFGGAVAVGPGTIVSAHVNGSEYVYGLATAPGTFTVTPLSPVKPSTPLKATFTGWNIPNPPLTYELREGASVVVAAQPEPMFNFSLPAGAHTLAGRIYDGLGQPTEVGPVSIIVDGAAPSITKPEDMTVPTDRAAGAFVSFEVTATDDFDANPTVTIDPPSDSLFPEGQTIVHITATDAAGNSSSAEFTITVTEASTSYTATFTKGEDVPNAGVDSRIQAGAKWTTLGNPAINNGGAIAVLARWVAPAAKPLPAQAGSGIFVGDELLVKAGEAVPGLSGATFKTFRDPVIDDFGHVAFIATIAGSGVNSTSDTVIVTNGRDGNLEVLAREGGVAPDADNAIFKAFSNVSIQSAFPVLPGDRDEVPSGSLSGIVFTASLVQGSGSPAVVAGSDTGAWWLASGEEEITRVVREGDLEFGPAEAVKTFSILKPLSGSPGHGRGQTLGDGVLFQATSTQGAQAIVSGFPDDFLGLALSGDSIYSETLPGAVWSRMDLPSSDLAQQHISMLASLKANVGGIKGAAAKGIFLSEDFGFDWEPLVRAGDAAPGFGTGVVFSTFKDPVNSAFDGGVAFLGATKGSGVGTTNNDGLWWRQGCGCMTLVAREGDEPPGAPGAKWKAFTSMALPGGATGPVFTASLQRGPGKLAGPGGITSIDDVGLYAVDSAGQVREILRENQSLLGKTVKTFSALKAVAGSAGVGRSYNSAAAVVALVTFTDHSVAMVRVRVP